MMRDPGLGLSPWLLGVLWLPVMVSGPSLPHVEQFQVVWSQRLATPRARRALPSHWSPYPESVSYLLGGGGHNFTLHLRKNRELLSARYTETYTAANGSEVVEHLGRQDHCLYQGHVEGHQSSVASISTCEGLRGFFRASRAVHLIEPLDGVEEGQHALYQWQHLKDKLGTCGVSNAKLERILGPRIAAAYRPRNRPPSSKPRHVEMYVVTDSLESQLYPDQQVLRRRVMEVVNHVDKLYQPLNFRVGLVGLQMWSSDKILVSSNPQVTLDNFQAWRTNHLVSLHTHDNAQLITGIDFDGITLGLANVASMCTRTLSAGVNQDHNKSPLGVASTIAHEMGHNLAMDHDDNVDNCYCPVPRVDGGCVMAASLGQKFPTLFSECSRMALQSFVETPQTACVLGELDTSRLVSDPVCGNKLLERGEQCDCGSPQECQNRCCNATTCLIAKGAKCARGACCDQCKVKPAGVLCRSAKDTCDLAEHCDGQRPECPEDDFQENGSPCPGGYCYNGLCPTLRSACSQLWGTGAQEAADVCFTFEVSINCQALPGQAKRCGVLFCRGGQKPTVRTSCILSPSSGPCQALLMEDHKAYETVPVGTKCGQGKVCWKGSCQDLQVYRAENCSAKCNGHGVCNHKNKCHCQPGWVPPKCMKPKSGVHTAVSASGGLSSGAVVGMVILLLALLLLGAAFVYYLMHKNAAPKAPLAHSNPGFHQGGRIAASKAPVGHVNTNLHQGSGGTAAPKAPVGHVNTGFHQGSGGTAAPKAPTGHVNTSLHQGSGGGGGSGSRSAAPKVPMGYLNTSLHQGGGSGGGSGSRSAAPKVPMGYLNTSLHQGGGSGGGSGSRSAAPKVPMGYLNTSLHQGGGGGNSDGAVLGKKQGAEGPAKGASTPQASRASAPTGTPKQPPPLPSAAASSQPFPVPVCSGSEPEQQLRPDPPVKPLAKQKPRQVSRPPVAPPTPPAKPGAGGSAPSRPDRPAAVPAAPPTKPGPGKPQPPARRLA
ncbi:disintegrin and metalloproteinase domain-containing protein 8 [Echinops telfairi]|uniref:Disintegrin and metalloproteinase domain-containing protein 8 n=1 Tax=Echinops telfairi TaxID=9371 RepID=A0AC55D738_ECHTE|nr:disintegrin and metalloproteinase domain-containing protein 8 [Echinops telfairi]